MQTTVFRDVTPCSFVAKYQRFGGCRYLNLSGSRVLTSVCIYKNPRRHIPDDSSSLHKQSRLCELPTSQPPNVKYVIAVSLA
jgi:hypothetical protein